MTIQDVLANMAGSGPLAGLLLYALYYQTQRVRDLEVKVEALYERVMTILKTAATGLGDSHDA